MASSSPSSRSLWRCSTCTFAKNTWAGSGVPDVRRRRPCPPPQDPPPPTHPSGVVVEIVGTERGDQGRSCEEHEVNCGEVLAEDVVVRLHTHDVEHARFVLIRAVGAALGDETRPIAK